MVLVDPMANLSFEEKMWRSGESKSTNWVAAGEKSFRRSRRRKRLRNLANLRMDLKYTERVSEYEYGVNGMSSEKTPNMPSPLQTKAHDVAENDKRRSGGGVHANAFSLAQCGSWMQPFELH